MNPYWQIAYEHLSIDELEEILELKRQKKELKPISEERKRINELKKLFQ